MQRFTLLHDGSVQGWQATYLALHVAVRLGAPLQVLHVDPNINSKTLQQRVAHVETGSHAAGVAIETHLLADLSIDTLKKHVTAIDGFFLPRRLLTDEEAVSRFLKAFSCPLWIVSTESKYGGMAVLVRDPVSNMPMISYARTLSHRLQQSLTGLIADEDFESILGPDLSGLRWMSLPNISPANIAHALEQLHTDLLVLSASDFSRVLDLPGNHLIYPDKRDA